MPSLIPPLIWPFRRSESLTVAPRRTIETIYGMIVAQTREPAFYERFGVPDTVSGRFDLLLLHMWLVLRRLRREGPPDPLSQALFDRFCEDMDGNLREMAVGDLAVPKRMRKFGEAFYGRMAAYDAALDAGGDALAQAIDKNVLFGRGAGNGQRLAAYAVDALKVLSASDDEAVRDGRFVFPSPGR